MDKSKIRILYRKDGLRVYKSLKKPLVWVVHTNVIELICSLVNFYAKFNIKYE